MQIQRLQRVNLKTYKVSQSCTLAVGLLVVIGQL